MQVISEAKTRSDAIESVYGNREFGDCPTVRIKNYERLNSVILRLVKPARRIYQMVALKAVTCKACNGTGRIYPDDRTAENPQGYYYEYGRRCECFSDGLIPLEPVIGDSL